MNRTTKAPLHIIIETFVLQRSIPSHKKMVENGEAETTWDWYPWKLYLKVIAILITRLRSIGFWLSWGLRDFLSWKSKEHSKS